MQSIQFPFRSFLYNFNRQLKNSPVLTFLLEWLWWRNCHFSEHAKIGNLSLSSDKQERQHSSQLTNRNTLLKVCLALGRVIYSFVGAKPSKPPPPRGLVIVAILLVCNFVLWFLWAVCVLSFTVAFRLSVLLKLGIRQNKQLNRQSLDKCCWWLCSKVSLYNVRWRPTRSMIVHIHDDAHQGVCLPV